MSVDFAALAQTVVSSVPDVRACLVMSRDGLVLGSHPAREEEETRSVWTRVSSLGEVQRGFAVVQEELWVFSRRGPYAAIATAAASARPGLLLDRLDQVLMTAEEARARRSRALTPEREPQSVAPAPRGPRTPLHKDAGTPTSMSRRLEPELEAHAAFRAPAERVAPAGTEPSGAPAAAVGKDRPDDDESAPPDDGGEFWVDHVALVREFRGLFLPDVDEER